MASTANCLFCHLWLLNLNVSVLVVLLSINRLSDYLPVPVPVLEINLVP
eukprot:SAG31_NODE_11375_length_1037_cov_1.303838_2_plen_48_part_01